MTKKIQDIEVLRGIAVLFVCVEHMHMNLFAWVPGQWHQMFYTCRYAAGGQLLDVPADVMTLDAAKDLFYDAPLGGQTCDGKLYGFPAEYNIEYGGAYVNPALFEAAWPLPYGLPAFAIFE